LPPQEFVADKKSQNPKSRNRAQKKDATAAAFDCGENAEDCGESRWLISFCVAVNPIKAMFYERASGIGVKGIVVQKIWGSLNQETL
jgi:hypothetical protein